jgi:Na+-transporting methylmalonyl-CoA/oxaloacetate decarboxylase beta subunit
MKTLLIGAIAFAAGVGTGLLVAKLYVRHQVQGGVDSLLGKVGLGGGSVQTFVDTIVVPSVTG